MPSIQITKYFTFWLVAAAALMPLSICRAKPPELTIVFEHNASVADWADSRYPAFNDLLRTGAVGLMNTRTKNDSKSSVSYDLTGEVLSLASGSRCAGPPDSPQFNSPRSLSRFQNTSFGDLYSRYTGHSPAGAALLSAKWTAVEDANRNLEYDIHLGKLADILRQNAYTIGTDSSPLSQLAAADSQGRIWRADRTQSWVRIIDVGPHGLPANFALNSIITQAQHRNTTVIVISLSPNVEDIKNEFHLTPLAILKNPADSGMLTSATTRRAGIVTNIDLLATVLNTLRIPVPTDVQGSVMSVQHCTNPTIKLIDLDHAVRAQHNGQHWLPDIAVFLALCIAGLSITLPRQIAFACMILPLAITVSSLILSSIATLLGVTVALTAVSLFWVNSFGAKNTVLSYAVASVIVILVDIMTGCHLLSSSILGYSFSEGARYYGIGNEAYGLLLGAATTIVAYAETCRTGYRGYLAAAGIVLASVVILSGLPSFGAKGGDVLVGIPLLLIFCSRFYNIRLSLVTLGIISLTSLSVLICVAILDNRFGGQHQSHLGRMVELAESQGASVISKEALRKLLIEGRLLTMSTWACTFWIGVLGLYNAVAQKRSGREHPGQRGIWEIMAIVGVICIVAFNDAGAVAASLFLVFVLCWAAAQRSTAKTQATIRY